MRIPDDTRTARLLVALALTFALALAAAFVQGGSGAAWALENEAREVGEPELVAGAWALADLQSGEFLGGEAASARLPMASTTKIMTALVTLEGGTSTRRSSSRAGPQPSRPRPTATSASWRGTL